MARVLNIKATGGVVPPGAVYIGRANRKYGLPESKWNNPYRIRKQGKRDEVIAKFREYLLGNARLMAELHELRGRDLVCWCAPLPCHGDVLLELANSPHNRGGLTKSPRARRPREERRTR